MKKKAFNLELFVEEITELYNDSVRDDGFDSDYFNDRISGHWQAAQIDHIDQKSFLKIVKGVASKHLDKVIIAGKKAA